jgi:2,4-dienoyl-CoA reductase-like NADH-dependent reductase (Old Yellow Enzyme family)
MAPMPTFAALPDGRISAAEICYLRRRASGRLGAIVTAGCNVTPEGLCFEGQWSCDRDELLDSLRQAADAIHYEPPQGQGLPVRAILQLCHAGAIAPSRHPRSPASVSESDVGELCDAFAQAARRGQKAGFDGVEIHGGHGYLPQQFFSPRTNSRDWPWGGLKVESRSRFPLALVAAIRKACGDEFSLWYRLTPEETEPDGIRLAHTLALAKHLAAAGVDVIDVATRVFVAGSIHESGDSRPVAATIQQEIADISRVMGVGRIERPQAALQVVNAGVPLVGLGRILLTEPDWGTKVARGEAENLRESLPPDGKLEPLDLPEPVVRYLRGRTK